ncbi:MAG: acetate--CoA ligase family protein [Pigmentiphaga sp.]|uniref:acetate--CoA ligase family protein n=1 Tax=Pigmentiphaga sp. TaxID=1977564 RepID=UPI003B54C2DC
MTASATTTAGISFADLDRLMKPRSIMIVGASSTPGSLGHTTVENVLEHSDFQGDVHLVNPRGGELKGHVLHPDIDSVPAGPIDVALLLVPAEAVLGALRRCAARGVGTAVVFTGGFGEVGDDGKAAERAMRDLARDTGMRIYGPNCAGLTSLAPRLGLTFSTEFRNDGHGGPLVLVTQGGGLGRSLMQGSDRGVRFGRWFSTGNEVDLDSADFIAWLARQDDVRAICVVMEGIKDGVRFLAAIQAAHRAGKPVAVLKVGRSSFGAQAAQSHTASLAGEDAVNEAVFAQYGVIRVDDLDEMLDVASLLARAGGRPFRRICVYSSSGGAGVLAADMISAAGLEMAELSAATIQEMARHAPSYAALANPVDLTTKALTDTALARRCLVPLFADPGIDAVIYPITSNYAATTETSVRNLMDIAREAPIPFVPVWMSSRRGPAHDLLIEQGFAPLYSLRNATRAMARCDAYVRAPRERLAGLPLAAPATPAAAGPWNEAQAKALFARHGIRVPREATAATAREAAQAATRIGFPVALKLVADGVQHKSDVGGVVLGVRDEAAAERAFASIMDAAARHGVAASAIRGVIVAEMVRGGIETLVGVHRDAVFGPMLSFGAGGVAVEIVADVARCRLPADRPAIEAMVDQTRVARLLPAHRGRPAYDRNALVDAIERTAALFLSLGDGVEALEINPLLVLEQGQGAVALDGVIH